VKFSINSLLTLKVSMFRARCVQGFYNYLESEKFLPAVRKKIHVVSK
jgi:hypothetical protein